MESLSLVLYFSLLGFVEDAKITADVLESPDKKC